MDELGDVADKYQVRALPTFLITRGQKRVSSPLGLLKRMHVIYIPLKVDHLLVQTSLFPSGFNPILSLYIHVYLCTCIYFVYATTFCRCIWKHVSMCAFTYLWIYTYSFIFLTIYMCGKLCEFVSLDVSSCYFANMLDYKLHYGVLPITYLPHLHLWTLRFSSWPINNFNKLRFRYLFLN